MKHRARILHVSRPDARQSYLIPKPTTRENKIEKPN